MSHMNFDNGVNQHGKSFLCLSIRDHFLRFCFILRYGSRLILTVLGFSSNQGLLANINEEWLENINEIDIFGTDVTNADVRHGM